MTRNECFRLLGLPHTASESEIRKQYKKMALRLHPDVNPDPKAHEAFILLSKAVDILLDPNYTEEKVDKRPSRRAGNETEEERLERMRVAKMRFEQQQMRQATDNTRYFLSLTTGKRWKIYQCIMWVSLVLSLAMTIELFLPRHYERDILIGSTKSLNNGIIRSNITRIKLRERGSYYIQNNAFAWESTYPEVLIESSWMLHTPIKMISTDDFSRYRSVFDFHVWSIRYLLIALLLVPLFPYLWRRKTLTFVFVYHLSFWGVGIISAYILLTQGRLLHVLSLGFL